MRGRVNRLAALGLAVLLLTVSVYADDGFSDVDDSAVYAEAVEYVSEAGIMNGGTGRRFNPNNTVTRAQMAAIVCRMVEQGGEYQASKAPFRDVPASHWASGYIQKAVSLNIISGFSDGTFRPENTLSFNQGITMLIRAVGLREEAESAGGYPNGYLTIARKHNVLTGISTQRTSNLKRYEIAMMIYNYYMGDTGASEETAQAANNSLADGKYEMNVFADRIGSDPAGNETAYAELLEAVILDNNYVFSLKVGDRISLEKYGLDDEIIVSKPVRELDGEIYIDDYTYLTQYGGGWMIWQYEVPIRRVVDHMELVLSSDTVVTDGYTGIMEGNPKDQRVQSLRAFFDRNSYLGEQVVVVTIKGGRVTEVNIPYSPM